MRVDRRTGLFTAVSLLVVAAAAHAAVEVTPGIQAELDRQKTTSDIHKGMPKPDVPSTSRSAWQGRPEFDESAQTYQIQISVPVLVDGQPAGALVVGISLSQLERQAKK